MLRQISLGLFVFLCCHINSLGQSILLHQRNANGIYHAGEQIQMTASINGPIGDSVLVNIRKNFSKQAEAHFIPITGKDISVFEGSFSEPTSLIAEVILGKDTGSMGLIVDPEKFKPGTARPKDLEAFWDKEKQQLNQLKWSVKAVPVVVTDSGISCNDMEINCTGPQPARGYFAKPVAAAARSLPIVIYFHSAGVSASWCRSEPGIAMRYAKMGKGALSFDLNAHGMLNGQPDAYYKNLDTGVLKQYSHIGLDSKSDIYFRGMYLRLLRTIDFLTTQPEWDGQRILLIGESQGGGQALAGAALDKRVKAVVVTVPAMCDWGGTLVGRRGSWPYPFDSKYDQHKLKETLPYFDVAHLLKDNDATIIAEIGLIDYTCPSSAVFAALNQTIGKKTILTVPYRAHKFSQQAYKAEWEEHIARPKNEFIRDYLK